MVRSQHQEPPIQKRAKRMIKRLGFVMMLGFNMATMACDLPAPCASSPQTVPFYNVVLAPNCKVNANYSFTDITGTHPNIFCYDNSGLTAGSFSWPYQGACVPTTPLPVVLKTVGPLGPGERLADAMGSLVIQNTTPYTGIVSCVYGF